MPAIDIICVGRMRDSAQKELFLHYQKQIQWPLNITEIDERKLSPDQSEISQKITADSYHIALDERGKSLKSNELAQKIESIQNNGTPKIQFIIGPADGLSEDMRRKSDFLLSFGAQTWPHMLARIMLIEQIYRCQQILNGHPYHRE